MSVNKVKLKVDEVTYKVKSYDLALKQDFDAATGRYKGIVFQIPLTITIEGKKEPQLLQWMINSTLEKDGTLTLFVGDEQYSSIKFKGYLVGYTENASESGMTCSLTIIFSSITAHEVAFTPAQED